MSISSVLWESIELCQLCSSKLTFSNILKARFPITSSDLVVTKLSNLTFPHKNNSFVQIVYRQDILLYFRQEHGECEQWLSSEESVHFQIVRKQRRHARRQFLNKLQAVKCEVRQVTFQKSQMSYNEHMSRYFCLLHTNYCSRITGLDLPMSEKGRLTLKDKDVTPALHGFK